jgi:hypothetical protein
MNYHKIGNRETLHPDHVVHSKRNEDGSVTVQLTSGNVTTYYGDEADELAGQLGYEDEKKSKHKKEEKNG